MKPSGILILSNIKNIKAAVTVVNKYVKNLYVHLNIPPEIKVQVPQWSSIISKLYKDFSFHDPTMDVRILINPIKKQQNLKLRNVEIIFCDGKYPDICETLKQFYQIDKAEIIINNETKSHFDFENNEFSDLNVHDVVVLGGTFDRIHLGHKIFLTEAVLKACKKIVVGVTDDNMLKSKTLSELILPTEQRINDVKNFLQEIDSNLQYEVVAIQDPFGPTKSDPDMDMIIVSEETYRGGLKVNEIRKKNNLKELAIYTIKIVESDPDHKNQHKETKISSGNLRMDLLGSLLREPELCPNISQKPYIIGLTGNIGSGKSIMAQRFREMGAYIIDCDKVAHDIYEPDQPAYDKIVAHFGQDIINPNRKINRKKLGDIVFSNPTKLESLNKLVWPEILEEAKRRIYLLENVDIVILEAAVLLRAGWEQQCHEVWSMIIPIKVAIERVMNRNNLTEDEARKRIESQPSNKEIVSKSHVVFSSEWSYEFTKHQAEKAWSGLKDRINNFKL